MSFQLFDKEKFIEWLKERKAEARKLSARESSEFYDGKVAAFNDVIDQLEIQ